VEEPKVDALAIPKISEQRAASAEDVRLESGDMKPVPVRPASTQPELPGRTTPGSSKVQKMTAKETPEKGHSVKSLSPSSTADTWNSKQFFKPGSGRKKSGRQHGGFEKRPAHQQTPRPTSMPPAARDSSRLHEPARTNGVVHPGQGQQPLHGPGSQDPHRQSSDHVPYPMRQPPNGVNPAQPAFGQSQHVQHVQGAHQQGQANHLPPTMIQAMRAQHQYHAALHMPSRGPSQGHHHMTNQPMAPRMDPPPVQPAVVFQGQLPGAMDVGGPLGAPHGVLHGAPPGSLMVHDHGNIRAPVMVYNPDAPPQQSGSQLQRRPSQPGNPNGRRRANSSKRQSPPHDHDGWKRNRIDPLHGPVFTRPPAGRPVGAVAKPHEAAPLMAYSPFSGQKRQIPPGCKNYDRSGPQTTYLACSCLRCESKRRTVFTANFLPSLVAGETLQTTLVDHFGRWGRVEGVWVTGTPDRLVALIKYATPMFVSSQPTGLTVSQVPRRRLGHSSHRLG